MRYKTIKSEKIAIDVKLVQIHIAKVSFQYIRMICIILVPNEVCLVRFVRSVSEYASLMACTASP